MSGAIVNAPRTVAEREALLEFVADVHMDGQQAGNYACNYDSGKARAYAEKKVPPLPTRTRTVPRVVRFKAHTGDTIAYTYEGGAYHSHYTNRVSDAAPDATVADIVNEWPNADIADADIAALLDLKARPTEDVTEAVAEACEPWCIAGHVFVPHCTADEPAYFTWNPPHSTRASALEYAKEHDGKVYELLLGKTVQP